MAKKEHRITPDEPIDIYYFPTLLSPRLPAAAACTYGRATEEYPDKTRARAHKARKKKEIPILNGTVAKRVG